MRKSSRMRIGLVTSEFPPEVGGVETYAYQYAAELGRRPEFDVTVYAPPSAARAEPIPGVTIKPILTVCRDRDWSRLRAEPIDLWHALSAPHAWLSLTGRPTVVSVHGNDFLAPYALTGRPGFELPLLYRIRPFLWQRLAPLWQRRTLALLNRALPAAKTIYANSQYTADVLIRQIPACAQQVKVGAVGVEDRFLQISRSPRGSRPRLLTVCRLSEPRKNVALVLHALANLKARYDFEYVVAGEGTQREALSALANDLGLADRVRFRGSVSPAALTTLYSAADLFVLTASVIPGSHEGFGIVYLEAAASGVPSLAARLAGAAEAVAEHVSGYFVDELSRAGVTNALEKFLAGAVTFDAERCREFARGYQWPEIVDRISRAYG